MAKVYKEVMVNGKTMKKWVEEHVIFKFDENGERIFPGALDFDEKYDDYDENGERKSLPSFEEELSELEEENLSELTEKVHDYARNNDEFVWKDKKGHEVFSIIALEPNYDVDSVEHPIHLVNYDKEFFFDYDNDTEDLINIKIYDLNTKELEEEIWFEYDKGTLIHKKSKKESVWYEYNKNLLIHEKHESIFDDSEENEESDYDVFHEYDQNENLIHKKIESEDSADKDYWYEYEWDEDGRLIYKKEETESHIEEHFYEYNSDGTLVSEKDSKGNERKWDEEGRLLYKKSNYDEELKDLIPEETWYKYDTFGNLVSKKDSLGNENKWNKYGLPLYEKFVVEHLIYRESWFEYNENKKLIYKKETINCKGDVSTYESTWFWSNNEKLISFKNSYGDCLEFDSNENLIHYYDGDCDEWYEYVFWENGNIKKKTCWRCI